MKMTDVVNKTIHPKPNRRHSTRFLTGVIWLIVAWLIMAAPAQAAEAITFYHNDILGSPVAVTNINGDLCWREKYKPYGGKLNNNDLRQPLNLLCGLDDNQRGYTNHVYDSDIKLTYMQARFYDPVVGRFMGIDPVGYVPNRPSSFNAYAYADNNPYKYIDPDGTHPADGIEHANDMDGMEGRIAVHELDVNQRYDYRVHAEIMEFARVAHSINDFNFGNPIRILKSLFRFVPKKTTILGENMIERVKPYADKTGSRTLPFGTTLEKWAKLTPQQKWKLNDGALRKRISEGDNFKYIGQDAYRDPALRRQFDLTGSELIRLKERGIRYKTVSPSAVIDAIGRQ